MPPITSPFAQIRASMPPLVPQPDPAITAPLSMPQDTSLPAFPSSTPKVSLAKFDPSTASPEELASQPLVSRLRSDETKDLNPWGTPQNHPGFMGKLGHALSVATGGPNRRQYEEMGLQKSLQDLMSAQSTRGLQGAQKENLESEIQQREAPPAPEEETWKPLLGGNGQVVTAPGGKIIEVNKSGDVRAQDLPENTTIAPKPTAASGAFAQWASDPTKYENFQKTMAEIKAQVAAEHPHQAANSSFMNIYAAQKFLKTAYEENPALLPVASSMIGKLLGLTPEQTKVVGGVPLDQPLSPTTGQPIGRMMPSAPTTSTRTSGQNAEKFLTEYPRITADVNSAAENLGPVKGREVMGFLLGQVGSTGDPSTDQKLAKLRTDLAFVGSNAAKFHINSVRQAELFDKLAGENKSTAPAIQGFLDSIKSWAQTSANQQRGFGEMGNTGGDVQKFTDGGTVYNIPKDQVEAFRKDHPNAR